MHRGWISPSQAGFISEKNVAYLIAEVTPYASMEDTSVIFDLFGNSLYKFKHVDGSLVLPFKVGKGYHLLGDIQLDTDENNGWLIDQVKPIFALAKKLLTAIMAPLPRWVSLAAVGKWDIPPMWGGGGICQWHFGHSLALQKTFEDKTGRERGAGAILGYGDSGLP